MASKEDEEEEERLKKAAQNTEAQEREKRKGPKREFNFNEMTTDGRLKDVVLEREEA